MLPLREVIEGYEHDKLVETVSQNTNAYPQGEWPLVAGASAVLTSAGLPAANRARSAGLW